MSEPKLRFKRDDGSDYPEWKYSTLGNVCDSLQYGLNAAAKAFDGQNKYIRITDIDESTHKYLMTDLVSPDGPLEEKYSVNIGDILFARTGASVGKTYLYDSKDGLLYFAGFLIRAHIKNCYNAGFIYAQTLTKRYGDWVIKTSRRSGQPGINADELSGFVVQLAISLEEQQKIADFLSAVDEVIAESEKEVTNLEKQKKSVMKKIFSQEIRFTRPDGSLFPDWEEKSLSEICTPLQYGMNTSAKEFDGENKYIRITDIDDITHSYSNSNIVSPSGELDNKYLVREGDILFARTGASTGKTYLYKINDGKMFFAGFLIRAHVKDNYNCYFIFSQTLTSEYEKWVKKTSQRSGQPGINAEEYSSYKMKIPCLEEQKLIADFLSDFDEAIAAAQKELSLWKQLKKALLQQLFV
ncbi:MAG: restriction endonuclease subunit S [Anaerolineaceae bacterium]|nr:restriction endonuclease subunit S [Anaerolineaceae bacterium]